MFTTEARLCWNECRREGLRIDFIFMQNLCGCLRGFASLRSHSNRLCILVALLLSLTSISVQADAELVKITTDPQSNVVSIPEDFLGFGYETSAVAQAGYFTDQNRALVQLYRNLSHQGLIRIGGNISDHTRFEPGGVATVNPEERVTIINETSLKNLASFARATGWKVMWGLNLGTGSKEQAVQEAVAVDSALGANLQSFEIGNEVDLMRRYARDFDAYHAAYTDYKAAIRARLPHAVFSGPDVAGNFSFVEKFVAPEAGDMKLATHHYYRGGASSPRATLQTLLTRDEGFDLRLDALHTLCTKHHLDYRINEVNSFSGGGKPGVSDTFGSALWCLDYMFDLASHGCSGVNMETDINQHAFISHYSPIVHDTNGHCTARPEYYAMLAFAMVGHGRLVKTTLPKSDINCVAYSTQSNDASWVIVINKDFAKDAQVEFELNGRGGAAKLYRLMAPSIDAKDHVTLAGSFVADDGTWTPGNAENVRPTDGRLEIHLPHSSAALIRIDRSSRPTAKPAGR